MFGWWKTIGAGLPHRSDRARFSSRPARAPRAGRPSQISNSVTLLAPFDIGRSYLFRAHGGKAGDQWAEIFRDLETHTWKPCAQINPKLFSKPLGWSAKLPVGVGEHARRIRDVFPKASAGNEDMRAIFYPLGIAVFVLRADSPGPTPEGRDQCWKLLAAETDPAKDLSLSCRELLTMAADSYTARMDAAAKRPWWKFATRRPPVVRLTALDHSRSVLQLEYQYQVFYAERFPADIGKEQGFEEVRYGEARIRIGWTEAVVVGARTAAQREEIETIFLIALASWYALAVMDQTAGRYLHDAAFGMASGRHPARPVESGAIRLAYMEGANASQPICWTTSEPDLLLLERIHQRWSTARWWANVDQRTTLLKLHYDQLEASVAGLRNLRLAFLGVTIACITLVSAVADVIELNDGKENSQLHLALAIGIPLILVGFAALYALPALRGRRERKKIRDRLRERLSGQADSA